LESNRLRLIQTSKGEAGKPFWLH